jgi:4-amino-4-deoxy-L-arabinose transferase-like glycosyltransferase
MIRRRWWGALATLLLLAPVFLLQLDQVPFHPDESSLLYQSRDLELALHSTPSLFDYTQWETDPAVAYRVLNAPLAKYVLALGRGAAGYGPASVDVDWDWGLGWRQNLAAGAMPPAGGLLGARAASALLALLAAPVLWLAGRRLGGNWAAWGAAGSYGLNALVLLHGRRAMAEGTLLFAASLAVLTLLSANRRPLLAGAAGGLALAAKHSALPLAISAWLAALLTRSTANSGPVSARWRRLALALAGTVLVVLVLSPYMWSNPFGAVRATVQARSQLLAEQVRLTEELAPDRLLNRPDERLAAMVGHLFFLPVQLREIGNYDLALTPAYQQFQSSWRGQLLRGVVAGGILLGLCLLGVALSTVGWRKLTMESRWQRTVLLVATVLQGITLLLANPLPIQRYYLPLVPLVCLWAGIGITEIVRGGRQVLTGRRTNHEVAKVT